MSDQQVVGSETPELDVRPVLKIEVPPQPPPKEVMRCMFICVQCRKLYRLDLECSAPLDPDTALRIARKHAVDTAGWKPKPIELDPNGMECGSPDCNAITECPSCTRKFPLPGGMPLSHGMDQDKCISVQCTTCKRRFADEMPPSHGTPLDPCVAAACDDDEKVAEVS